MTIALDIRPFLSGPGGVAEYTRHVAEGLVSQDSHSIILFSAGTRIPKLPFELPEGVLHVHYPYPSKIVAMQALIGVGSTFDEYIYQRTGKKIDVFFAPNYDFINLSPSVRFVITIHDCTARLLPDLFSPKSNLWHRAVRPEGSINRADHIIAVSHSTKQDIVDLYGISPDRIHVTHLGIDDLFRTKQEMSGERNCITFLNAHERRKNAESVFVAYASATRRSDRVRALRLVCAGTASGSFERIKSLAHRYGIAHLVDVVGYLSREEQHALLRRSRMLVYPSFYEGYGLPPLEAMATGAPVIAAANSSIGEVTNGGVYLINPYDISSLEDALCDLAEDDALFSRLVRSGRQTTEVRTWKSSIDSLLHVFDEMTTRHTSDSITHASL